MGQINKIIPTEQKHSDNSKYAYWKGKKHTEEYKRMMSEACKGKKVSKETAQKISRARKGIKFSSETRMKISAALKGIPLSEETKRKLSEGHKKKGIRVKMTPEVRAKLRAYRLGRPLSILVRQKQSNALVGKLPANMINGGAYSNIRHGWYDINGKRMHFRSKWEANYALYLDFLKTKGEIKDWEFESDVFIFEKIKFGTRSYRPDFKVFTSKGEIEYHEVKGYMDAKSSTKLKRMKKYYPNVKIILIDRDQYYALAKMGRLFGWD